MIGVFIFIYLFIALMVYGEMALADDCSRPSRQVATLAIWWPVVLVVWLLVFLGKGHYDLIRSLIKK